MQNNLTQQIEFMDVRTDISVIFSSRHDTAGYLASAAGNSTIEHEVTEACSLLSEGEPRFLLIVCDTYFFPMFSGFSDSYLLAANRFERVVNQRC